MTLAWSATSRSTASACITQGGTQGVLVEALYMATAPSGWVLSPAFIQASAKHSFMEKSPLEQLTSRIQGFIQPLLSWATSELLK